ncbi:5873_t:CDS:2 [Entrophospora sp. SA101]|nr:5873_t:CDS:2 [Entrophospora sp. SA101]
MTLSENVIQLVNQLNLSEHEKQLLENTPIEINGTQIDQFLSKEKKRKIFFKESSPTKKMDAQSTYPYSSQEVELVESGQLSLSQLLHLFCNQEIFNMEDDECLILEIICMGQYTTQVHLK